VSVELFTTQDSIAWLLLGKCERAMGEMPDNYVDTIITDPPYGLQFMGKKWDYDVPSVETFQEMLRVAKPGATLLCFAGARTQHRMAVNIEDAGWELKDCIMWIYGSGFPKATDISKQIDRKFGVKGEVMDKRKGCSRKRIYNVAVYSGSSGREYEIVAPTTPEAKLWNGWKSHGLKPAYEPILVAMKPNEGSYAQNALKWGVSGLNIDGARIELKGIEEHTTEAKSGLGKRIYGKYKNKPTITSDLPRYNIKGRYPANIILDEEAARMLDEQIGDQGGASRFFYVAKASRAERNMGLEDLPAKERANINKMMGSDDNSMLTGSGNKRNNKLQNFHPTVKPLELIVYLCNLTKTPFGGVVLDPYMGSGTTGIACLITGRDFIGIEMKPDYYKVACERSKYVSRKLLKIKHNPFELISNLDDSNELERLIKNYSRFVCGHKLNNPKLNKSKGGEKNRQGDTLFKY